jgi:hypothetical protein
MLELSRGTAYGLAFSQVAITLGVILFFPPVDVEVFFIQGHINITARTLEIDPSTDLKGSRIFMAMPTLLCSLLAAGFAAVTLQSYEQGFAGQDYQPDVLEQSGMWNIIFWVHCLLAHAVAMFIISDPVNIFGAVSATCFMVYFLYRACYPKGSTLNLTQENINILFYCLGILQMAYQLTDTRQNGAYVIMTVVILDYFLGLGHTYDRQATLDTVANCRLFYICIVSLSLAFLYGMSSEPPPPSFA